MNRKNDPMGRAIAEYQATGTAERLRVFSPMFEEDEIPLPTLFRTFDEMPETERRALRLAQGKTLDVGAAAGCHSLVLQHMGIDVTGHLDKILTPGGQLLCDSSDISYVFDDETAPIDYPDSSPYYGEQNFQMQYKDTLGEPFPWLYIDAETLKRKAAGSGYSVEVVVEGEHYDYLARITRS